MTSATEPGFVSPSSFPHLSFERRLLEVPRFARPTEIKPLSRPARSLAWNVDGSRVAVGTEFKGLKVYAVKGNGEVGSSTNLPASSSSSSPHNGHVSAVAFSPTNPNILISGCKSASSGGVVCVWDLENPSNPIATFPFPLDVLSLSWHPSGLHFAATLTKSSVGRDEVVFFRHTSSASPVVSTTESGSLDLSSARAAPREEKWEKRTDIGLGGSGGSGTGLAEEINSFQFIHSGKACLGVDNIGCLTLWAYPLADQHPLFPSALNSSADLDRPNGSPTVPIPNSAALPSANGRAPTGETPTLSAGTLAMEGEAGPSSPHARSHASRSRSHTPDAGLTAPDDNAAVSAAIEVTVDPPAAADDPSDRVGDVGGSGGAMEVDPEPLLPLSAAPSRPSSPGPSAIPPTVRDFTQHTEEKQQEERKVVQLKRVRKRTCHSGSLLVIAQDPAGQYIAIGGHDAQVSLLTTRDWITIRTFDIFTGAIRHLAFSPSSELLAVGGDEPNILLLSVYTGQVVARFPSGGITVQCMAWHPGPSSSSTLSSNKPLTQNGPNGSIPPGAGVKEGKHQVYREELAWCASVGAGTGARPAVVGRTGQAAGGSWWVSIQEGEKAK